MENIEKFKFPVYQKNKQTNMKQTQSQAYPERVRYFNIHKCKINHMQNIYKFLQLNLKTGNQIEKWAKYLNRLLSKRIS